MALTEQVQLDIQAAQAQIDRLENQLTELSTPINVPVNVTGEQALSGVTQDIDRSERSVDDLNRELRQTETELRDVEGAADRGTQGVLRFGTRGASAFTNMRGSILGVVAALGAIQGARALGSFFADSVTAASDLEQAVGGVRAIFGDASDDLLDFGETADQSVGLAESAFNQLASQLGAQLQTFGFNAEAAADETQNLIELGADLAATFGGPVSGAVEAIGSLLRGEINPIERYGVSVNQAAIAARALELGLVNSTSEMDIQARATAALNLLYEQTGNAQGQFAREADTTAGLLERLSAQSENAQAALGEALQPAVNAIIEALPGLIDGLSDLAPVLASFGTSFAQAAEDGSTFINVFGDIPNVIGGVFDVFGGAAGAIINFNQAAFDLITLDFGGFAQNVQDALGAVADLQVDLDLRTIREDLLDLLRAGEDPLAVLTAGIAEVGQSTGNLERFADEVERIFAITGVEDEAAIPGLEFLIDNADALGLSVDEVEFLREILQDIRVSEQLDRDVAALLRLGAAAREGAIPIQRNADAIDEFNRRVGEIRAGQIAEELEGVSDVFDQLPDGMDAAAAALRDSEDEIITDFTTFLGNLEDEIEARQAFRSNIAILQAMGLDNLAQVFTEEGLEAAGALADAVANPEEARRAEELLDAEATAIGNSFRETLIATIEGQGLDLSLAADATIAIQSLVLSGLDTAAAQAEVGNQVRDAVGGVGGPGADRNAGITNVQNFNGFTPSDTDLARANQSVNAIVVD